MIKIEKLLLKKEEELKELIERLKKSVEEGPEGNLRITHKKYGVYYYHCMNDDAMEENKNAVKNSAKMGSAKMGSAKMDSAKMNSAKMNSVKMESAEMDSAKMGNAKMDRSKMNSVKMDSNKKNLRNNGIYIKKKNMELVKGLAQKSYDIQVLDWAEKCHKHLVDFLKVYYENGADEIYDAMSKERKRLVCTAVPTVKDMVEIWLGTTYEGKTFQNEDVFFLTENGEKVRSKSEKILADKFFFKGIPYKYECPLKIDGYGIIYPDFTLMNVNNGKMYYWEHFGMMDDEEYARKAIKKIESYERNGIFPGKQLITTFETKKGGFHTNIVEIILQEYFQDEA